MNNRNHKTGIPSGSTKILRPPAAADYLQVSQSTMAKWRMTGLGPEFIKMGRAVAYELDALDRFVAKCRRASTSATSAPADEAA